MMQRSLNSNMQMEQFVDENAARGIYRCSGHYNIDREPFIQPKVALCPVVEF